MSSPQKPRKPLLTPEQERELSARIKGGDAAARNELVEANLGLAKFAANRFRSDSLPDEDMVQEGNLGLIRAAQDFDPDAHAVSFSTYATIWIEAYIYRALIASDSLIRIPERVYLERERHGRSIVALGGQSGDDESSDVADPEDNAVSNELCLLVDAALTRLNPVEAWVLRERYGINPEIRDKSSDEYYSKFSHRTYAELGQDCGLNKHRIRQIELAAIQKLRNLITRD